MLVVEDQEPVRRQACRILAAHGYEVTEAPGGEEALAAWEEVDVLVTDVVMPGMTGQQLAQMAVERNPDLRVVYMSGHTEDVLVRDGARARNLAFVQKPFTRATLLRAVEDALAAAPGRLGGGRGRAVAARRPRPRRRAQADRRASHAAGRLSRRERGCDRRGGLCIGLLPAVPNPPGAAAHRLGAGAPNTGASSLRPGRHAVLEGALHGGVDGVEALQRERLGGGGAPIAVVGEHAVREGEAPRLVQRRARARRACAARARRGRAAAPRR